MAAIPRIATLLAGAAAFSMLPATAPAAEDYPNRPIELIVTFGPGGGSDVMGRQVARALEPILGVSIPVSNVAGASGNAGLTRLVTSPADGYTLATMASLTVASWAGGIGDVTADDLKIIGIVQSTPALMFVRGDSPFQTAEELFEHARENPGDLTVATSGYGTQHDVKVQLLAQDGVEMVNVPFAAPAERYASTVGGHTDVLSEEPGDVRQFIESGELRPLLVFDFERHPDFPDLPTAAELGHDIAGLYTFRAVVAPPDTPDEIIERLEAAIVELTATDEWQTFCTQTYTCIEPVFGDEAREMVDEFYAMISEHLDGDS